MKSSNPEATGDCYEAAGRYMQDATIAGEADNLTLVHGVVNGQGPLEGRRIDHAWIEVEERAPGFPVSIWLVVDRSMGRNLVLPREMYYRAGQIEPDECRRYTPEEMTVRALKHGHWGPWEE